LELARRFRTLHPKTPVLMVSGSLETIDDLSGYLDRFGILAKPYTSTDLAHGVRTLLRGAISHHALAFP